MMRTLVVTFTFLLSIFAYTVFAQTGIGTRSPHPSAILDVSSSSKGLRLPIVSLTNRQDVTTVANPVQGLVIYNSSVSGSGQYAVSKGLYQYTGTIWEKLLTEKETDDEVKKVPFLSPRFVAQNFVSGTPPSNSNGATVLMTFNNLDYNYNNGATGTSGAWNGYTVDVAGYYMINFSADMRNTTEDNNGDQLIQVRKNGTVVIRRGVQRKWQVGGLANFCLLSLVAGDKIDFNAYSNGDAYRVYNTYVSIFKIH